MKKPKQRAFPALEQAYATEGRDGQLLLGRCLQMQSTTAEALDEYVIALKRFSEVCWTGNCRKSRASRRATQQSQCGFADENPEAVRQVQGTPRRMAAISKQAVDASQTAFLELFDRLWGQCERGVLACVRSG